MSTLWGKMELPWGRRLVRDKVYGFLKVMPRPSGEEIASFYANAYRNPCVLHDPEGRADIVCEYVPQPGRILDIGCGRGELLEVFMHRRWEVMGIEPWMYAKRCRFEEAMRKACKDKLRHRLCDVITILFLNAKNDEVFITYSRGGEYVQSPFSYYYDSYN